MYCNRAAAYKAAACWDNEGGGCGTVNNWRRTLLWPPLAATTNAASPDISINYKNTCMYSFCRPFLSPSFSNYYSIIFYHFLSYSIVFFLHLPEFPFIHLQMIKMVDVIQFILIVTLKWENQLNTYWVHFATVES